MAKTNSITIENEKILRTICGVNDKILKTIEKVCDCKLYYSGNEIHYESENPNLIEKILNILIQLSEKNNYISENNVEVIYKELKSDSKMNILDLLNVKVEIPKSKTVFRPKTINQSLYLKLLEEKDIVFASGPAGTGKTYIAIVYALNELLNKRTKKVVLTRPIVEAGENLGFLPGDYVQKINPYLVPLLSAIDSLLPQEVQTKLNEQNMIEIAPLAYMRGRTFSNSIVILDEAQNSTYFQMKLFLTRQGEEAKLIITGDLTQIDLPKNKNNGMISAIKILKPIEEIGFIEFNDNDVVRHPLVKKILSRYNYHENS